MICKHVETSTELYVTKEDSPCDVPARWRKNGNCRPPVTSSHGVRCKNKQQFQRSSWLELVCLSVCHSVSK